MKNDNLFDKKPEECYYSFFQHRDCEFFPCHQTQKPEEFNCLFCYCPLYALGSACGGNFVYLENGIKDCSRCLLPHGRSSYTRVMEKFPLLSHLASENRRAHNGTLQGDSDSLSEGEPAYEENPETSIH